MKIRIALIVKEHFVAYCREKFPFENETMVLIPKTYDTLEQLVECYREMLGQCDAVITSGLLPQAVLKGVDVDNPPVFGSFCYDVENTYRIILREGVRRNHLDLSRIRLEALPPDVPIEKAVEENSLPYYATLFGKRFSLSSMEELQREEDRISQEYIKLVEEGKIDYILTYFYSVVENLTPYGIDCYYLYPSETEFYRVIDQVCTQVALRMAEKSAPAVVHLTLRPIQAGTAGMDLRIAELHTALLEYIRLNQYDISVKQGSQYFHLYTDARTLEQMTQRFSVCPLTRNIPLVGQLCSAVGYGAGNSFFQATQNATKAAQYALELNSAAKASYYIDSSGNLTALSHQQLAQQSWIEQLPKDQLLSLAGQASLSVDTIVKLASVVYAMETDQLTSQDLIERLGLSLRTANRYLANLTKAGLAQAVGQKAMVKKGRPVTVYSLKAFADKLFPDR